jgi:hypothetical protein
MKSNGHDTSTSRVNGHGPVPPSRAAHEDMDAPIEPGRAASDDARDIPSAAGATSASAGTERDACAEVARPRGRGTRPGSNRASDSAGPGTPRAPSESHLKGYKKAKRSANIPPGSLPLPTDGVGFVDAMHAHVDLYLACARLVKSGDERIAQRMVERLLEMSYGKSPTTSSDGAPQPTPDAAQPIEE